MRACTLMASGMITAILCGGCVSHRHSLVAQPDRHHVVVLPGIDGGPWLETHALIKRINDRPGLSAEFWDWREPGVVVADIRQVERHRVCSQLLAHELITWRERHPDTAISLIAISGGTGIVLEACAHLPADFHFERMVLLAAAASPDRDLQPALSRVNDALYAYDSKADFLLLGIGTTLFCTMEGDRQAAAGYAGFRVPDDATARRKLVRGSWHPGLIFSECNLGSHTSGLSAFFASKHILPLFNADGPDRSTLWTSCHE